MCVTYVSFLIMAPPTPTTDTVMNPLISIILKMLANAFGQFSVASRLTLYKSSCVTFEFMVMLSFSIQSAYNGSPTP